VLRLNANRLIKIPAEIGKLEQLEELNLNENLLESIPNSIALCPVLRSLKLQNNRLKAIPFELADVPTLEECVVDNNPQLEMVPENWRGHSRSLLFICKVHRVYYTRMEELTTTNSDLVKHSQYLEQEQMLMQENIVDLRNNIDELKKAIPPKIAKRLEREAQIRAEAEVDAGDPKTGGGCAIL
jgi:Leucine-rich repeat (LRR) protein